MFEQSQIPPSRFEKAYVGTRILMIAGVALLVSLGLCGVGTLAGHHNDAFGAMTMLGFGLFLASLLGLVIGVITLVIELIARR